MNKNEPIRSRDNRHLVDLRKIRDGRERGRIFIEGKRLVREALRSPVQMIDCFFDEERIDGELLDSIVSKGVAVRPVISKMFDSIADTETPQGIICTAHRPTFSLEALAEKARAIQPIVFLNRINNPANLGAILRTAEAAGVAVVVISPGSTDAYSPKALRASMGSAFRIGIVENVEMSDAIMWAEINGRSAVALDISGRVSYTDLDWTKPRLLVFGSEAHGISEEELSGIGESVIIPMADDVESLNLAVSAGIVLFEAKRQNATD